VLVEWKAGRVRGDRDFGDDVCEEGRTFGLGQLPHQPPDDVALQYMRPIKAEEGSADEDVEPTHGYHIGLFVQGLDEVGHVGGVEHGREG